MTDEAPGSGVVQYERERLSTGVAGLDVVLGGGLPAGQLYLVEGLPGTGKTTLGLNFLLAGVERGESVMLVTHAETPEELAEVCRSHGLDVAAIRIHEWGIEEREEAAHEDSGYTLFHAAEVELGESMDRLKRDIEEHDPRRLVFDSTAALNVLSDDEAVYRRQIQVLRDILAARDCTTLLIDDAGGSKRAETIAHGILQLENLAFDYGPERRRLRVRKLRGVMHVGGYNDFVIQRGGLEVYPRLIAAEHHRDIAPEEVSTGIDELDALLGGGLTRASSALFIGPAGSGKSSLAGACAVAAARRGERALVWIFDETVGTWRNRLESLGVALGEYLDDGSLILRRVDPAGLTPGSFAHATRQFIDGGVDVVVIDSLNGYAQTMSEERHLEAHMRELLTYLNEVGVVTLMVMSQHGLLGATMLSPVDVSYLADTVVLLRYFEAAGNVRKAISVAKKRTGAHEATIRELFFRRGRIEIGKPLEEFSGVLSGVPTYSGNARDLRILQDDDNDHQSGR